MTYCSATWPPAPRAPHTLSGTIKWLCCLWDKANTRLSECIGSMTKRHQPLRTICYQVEPEGDPCQDVEPRIIATLTCGRSQMKSQPVSSPGSWIFLIDNTAEPSHGTMTPAFLKGLRSDPMLPVKTSYLYPITHWVWRTSWKRRGWDVVVKGTSCQHLTTSLEKVASGARLHRCSRLLATETWAVNFEKMELVLRWVWLTGHMCVGKKIHSVGGNCIICTQSSTEWYSLADTPEARVEPTQFSLFHIRSQQKKKFKDYP